MCTDCNKEYKKILTVEESQKDIFCVCGYKLERTPRPPSANVKEVLDNGFMTKRIERFSEAERLFKERSKNHKP